MFEIYSPGEDSYLMQRVLKSKIKDKKIRALEIGVGSGIILQTLKEMGVQEIFGVDINCKAVSRCKNLGFKVIESDLFYDISRKEKFDLIIFNPPYLPEDEREIISSRISTTGGKNGSEIINRFLEQAKDYLSKKGRIFLLTSSFTKRINFLNYSKNILGREKLFFEELFVFELKIS